MEKLIIYLPAVVAIIWLMKSPDIVGMAMAGLLLYAQYVLVTTGTLPDLSGSPGASLGILGGLLAIFIVDTIGQYNRAKAGGHPHAGKLLAATLFGIAVAALLVIGASL